MNKKLHYIGICLITILYACSYNHNHKFRQIYHDSVEAMHADTNQYRYLKAHMKNGDVALLHNWEANTSKDSIIGKGNLFNFKREKLSEGEIHIAFKDISLFETNEKDFIRSKDSDLATAVTVIAMINIGMSVFCATNPKACFGSCPTFYFTPDEDVRFAEAEGFSDAIIPALENRDVDALDTIVSSSVFSLYLKNEAYETHVIDDIHLELVPLDNSIRILQSTDDRFVQADKIHKPSRIVLPDSSESSVMMYEDGKEYYSLSDSFDLSTKESLVLNFEKLDPESSKGLVLNFRQTLLTTFLFYELLSLAGDEASDYLSQINMSDRFKKAYQQFQDRLGRIEVYLSSDKNKMWEHIGNFGETGPIARNVQLLRFPENYANAENLKVKLVMTKAHWRIDAVSLASLGDVKESIRVWPSVEASDELDHIEVAHKLSASDNNYLNTLPGDMIKLDFNIPPMHDNYQVFLSSEGYYLEWLREEWMASKNIDLLNKLIKGDEDAWTELALSYKMHESEMDSMFWSSKFPLNKIP